jgi:hypothetical protein
VPARLSQLPRRRSLRRRASAVAVLVAASGLLVACGDDSDDGSGGSSVVVLDDDQVKEALLTLDNLPDGWVESSEDDGDDDDAPGCLADLDDLEGTDSESDAHVDFEIDDELGLPALTNGVASFNSERDVTEAMDKLRDAFEDCDHVDYTDPDDGTEIVLDLAIDDEKSSPAVDDQFNLTATGTITNGLEFPFGLWVSVARVDNHTTTVMITDLSEDTESMLDPYTTIAVDRLVAVINGEEPEAVQGPAVGAEADATEGEDDSGDDEAFEQLPLDGGSYTWASGVTMKLTVDRVEPYGAKDDFCGDGSCGIANPDDTRVVLKYEVTVPADASEPFDASSCPGQLYPTSGNDEDALSGVYGDAAKPISGKIFPGSTKTGFDEYYLEKAYADQEFYIESSCGDTDYDGETAYFVGTFS